jgi:DMSO/TMAO reductase YedYZ molybdopterin-dependent catalytic subunit
MQLFPAEAGGRRRSTQRRLERRSGRWSAQCASGSAEFDDAADHPPLERRVVSSTGYDRRFPVGEASRLLLATRVGGEPLDPGHGYPARLVAADRRGFW